MILLFRKNNESNIYCINETCSEIDAKSSEMNFNWPHVKSHRALATFFGPAFRFRTIENGERKKKCGCKIALLLTLESNHRKWFHRKCSNIIKFLCKRTVFLRLSISSDIEYTVQIVHTNTYTLMQRFEMLKRRKANKKKRKRNKIKQLNTPLK